MKKFYVVLAVLLGFGIMKAYTEDLRNVPGSGNNTSIPADYGGVDIATNSFFVGLATVPSENGPGGIGYRKFYASTTTSNNSVPAQSRWTIYGVNFSTGLCAIPGASGFSGDFVSVQVSTQLGGNAREVTRFYNTVSISSQSVCGGITPLRWPIRVYGNLFWGVNIGNGGFGAATHPYNRADLLYYKESD